MFVRASSTPHARLLRAIDRGNLQLVRLAAVECERIDLETALRILLLLERAEPVTYERAAVRWAGRLLQERPQLGFAGGAGVLDGLDGLSGPDRAVAASRLALALRRLGEPRAAIVLERGGARPRSSSGEP